MDKPLTPKQEKFAQCVASGSTYSAAYRAAYNVGVNATSEGVNVSACKMMARANVRQRVEELRIPIEVQVGYTLKKYIEEMQELRNAALSAEEHGAAIKAMELIILVGLSILKDYQLKKLLFCLKLEMKLMMMRW